MFPVIQPMWLVKVYVYSRNNQAKEEKKDPVKASNASLGGHVGPGGVGGEVQGGETCVCAAWLFVLQASCWRVILEGL